MLHLVPSPTSESGSIDLMTQPRQKWVYDKAQREQHLLFQNVHQSLKIVTLTKLIGSTKPEPFF